MSPIRRSTLPNLITVARTLAAPAVSILILMPGSDARFLAFSVFTAAALSDLWDGYLARKHAWVTSFGTLMDPLADKLLLVACLLPIYLISHAPGPAGALPYWGALPAWVLVVIFGREALITGLRAVAARRGVIIPAQLIGKRKALVQNFFLGTALLWYALTAAARENGWTGGVWEAWRAFHGAVLALALVAAIVLTLYSLVVYLRLWRVRMGEAR